MSETIHIRTPAALVFEIARLGRDFTVPLPTRGQMRRASAIDPKPGAEESGDETAARRAKLVAIFAEATDLPVGLLTPAEEVQILHAIVAAHHGFDAIEAIAVQRLALELHDVTFQKMAADAEAVPRGSSRALAARPSWRVRCLAWIRGRSTTA